MALARLRRRWPTSVATGLALTAAVALSAAVALVDAVTAEAGLQDTVRQLGAGRYLQVDEGRLVNAADYGAARAGTTGAVGAALGRLEQLDQVLLQSEDLSVERGSAGSVVRLSAFEDLDRHVEVIQGRTPAAPRDRDVWSVTAPEAAVRNLGLRVGQVSCLDSTSATRPFRVACTELAGVWRPRDPRDPYWSERPAPDGVLTVDAPTLFAMLHRDAVTPTLFATVSLRFEPDLAQLHQRGVDGVLTGFRRLRAGVQLRGGALVTTDLDTTVQAFEDRVRLGRFTIELVAAELLLVTTLAVAILSGHALEGQRHTFAAWRSRGWSWHATWRLLLLEASALALTALPLGLALGWLATLVLARRAYGTAAPWLPPVRPDALLPAVGLGLGAALAVMAGQSLAATRRELLAIRREASRPALSGWWQRRALDLGLAAVSLPLLAATRLLGQSEVRVHGAGGDPVSLALPGVALVLLGVALLRLLPVAGAMGSAGARWLPAALATLQLRRRPVQHAGLALLVIVTTAVGVFAGAYAGSETRNVADRAAYTVGTDIRAHVDGARPPLADVVSGLPGVRAASFVYRTGGATQAGLSFQPSVLAVEPYSFRQVVWSRSDLAGRPLPDLLQELGDLDPSGVALPGRPDRIGVWTSGTGIAARLAADVVDGAGRPGRVDLGSLSLPGPRRLDASLTLAGPVRYPLRLRDLAVEPEAAPAPPAGSLALGDLAVAEAGGEPTVVERFAPDDQGLSDWWRAPAGPDGSVHLRASKALGEDGGPALLLDYDRSQGEVLVEPPASSAPIPALAPPGTLARAGIRVGEVLPLVVDSVTARFLVVAAVDHFPTFYPEVEDFLVVAQAPLLRVIAHDTGEAVGPADVWLRVGPEADVSDLAALQARPDVSSVQDRRSVEAVAQRDPVRRELETNLVLGVGAATALTVLSVVVHFLVTTRDRLAEYAILQANGLGRRTVLRSLAVEQALLVAVAAAAGGMAGLVLAWALVPALQLGADPGSLVPPSVVAVDPVTAGGTIGGVALLALAAARLASRAGSRFRLMNALRLLG